MKLVDESRMQKLLGYADAADHPFLRLTLLSLLFTLKVKGRMNSVPFRNLKKYLDFAP
jgi:hypothetical protein